MSSILLLEKRLEALERIVSESTRSSNTMHSNLQTKETIIGEYLNKRKQLQQFKLANPIISTFLQNCEIH
jgi:hypothetical protein